jgi:hypothetical protein
VTVEKGGGCDYPYFIFQCRNRTWSCCLHIDILLPDDRAAKLRKEGLKR